MAHKKAGGSTRNGRDSIGKRLGAKAFDGQLITGGSIIVRQRGNQFYAGMNVGEGKDNTIFAKVSGRVSFDQRGRRGRRYVDVVPEEVAAN